MWTRRYVTDSSGIVISTIQSGRWTIKLIPGAFRYSHIVLNKKRS